MKLWGSVRNQANKLAFDAEKALRARREESAISGLQSQIETQYTEMGRVVLALMGEGALSHPQLQPFAQEIARLQAEIKDHAEKLTTIQAEEYTPEEPVEGAGSAPSEPTSPPPPPPPPSA